MQSRESRQRKTLISPAFALLDWKDPSPSSVACASADGFSVYLLHRRGVSSSMED